MNLQTISRLVGKNPAKTGQNPSQIIPRKFLGWLARRGRSGPACPAVPKASAFPFAPDVIDRGTAEPRSLLRDLAMACCLVAVAAVLGFALGYLPRGGL